MQDEIRDPCPQCQQLGEHVARGSAENARLASELNAAAVECSLQAEAAKAIAQEHRACAANLAAATSEVASLRAAVNAALMESARAKEPPVPQRPFHRARQQLPLPGALTGEWMAGLRITPGQAPALAQAGLAIATLKAHVRVRVRVRVTARVRVRVRVGVSVRVRG